MIKKLTAANEIEITDLLRQEAILNLFILGDIENFGYDSDLIDIWGDYDASNDLRAIMLRFGNNFLPYAYTSDFDVAGLAALLNDEKQINMSGIPRVTEKFEACLPMLKEMRIDSHFAKCTNASMINANHEVIIRTATANDIDRIIAMRQNVTEFGERIESSELMLRQLKQGSKRIYYIEQDQQIVSVAESSAENSFSAMITGVATLKAYRSKGFASTLLKRLCCDLLAEGKTPCLFYHNPLAGKMYHQIGFEDVGDFVLYQ